MYCPRCRQAVPSKMYWRLLLPFATPVPGRWWLPRVGAWPSPWAGGGEHFRLPLDTKNPAALGRNATRLSALIAGEGVDLVHAHSRAPAWSAHFAARRRGRPFVTTFHGVYCAGNAVKRAYNRVMVRADRVIAPSNFVAEHIRTVYGCPEARIRVVHQGIDIASFDPRAVPADIRIPLHAAWAIADGVRVVLLPGRVSRLKGHAVLIEAMRELADEDLAAVFVGSDTGNRAYRRELEALAGNLNVRFIGHRDDMAAVYAASDIVVSASVRPESFGRVLAEAGAMGLPAVAADHGGRAGNPRARRDRLAGSSGRPRGLGQRHPHGAVGRRPRSCGPGACKSGKPLYAGEDERRDARRLR